MPDGPCARTRWPARLLLGVALLGALAACGDDDDDAASDTTAEAATTTAAPATTEAATTAAPATTAVGGAVISIVDFSFDPTSATVATGQPLMFRNDGGTTHSVASTTSDLLLSDPLAQGDEFTVTFDTPGTYDYFCGIHGSMTGTIEVTA